MKYSLRLKAGNNSNSEISFEFLEDHLGNITDEVQCKFDGFLDFEKIPTSLILNQKDLNNLIGLLLQVQQKMRSTNG